MTHKCFLVFNTLGSFPVFRTIMQGYLRTIHRSFVFASAACILACNYFAFQIELFEKEYEAHHHRQADTLSIGNPALNWESFDKDNAPKAFVFNAGLGIQLLFSVVVPPARELPPHPQYELVRDKSPPAVSSILIISLYA